MRAAHLKETKCAIPMLQVTLETLQECREPVTSTDSDLSCIRMHWYGTTLWCMEIWGPFCFYWSHGLCGLICGGTNCKLAPAYQCTAGEGDWLHVDRAPGKQKLVYLPDSDVPHIGLTSADLSSDDVIVQLSSMGTPLKLFNMNNFVECLKTDPDLHSIPPAHRGKILQVIYIATGCDFVSFFVGIGKATFLKAFFQYAQFIMFRTTTSPDQWLPCTH